MSSDLSVVVDDLHVLGSVVPDEADTPLIVDPDGMLAFPSSFEGFQTIPGGGELRSASRVAASSMSSFREATFAMLRTSVSTGCLRTELGSPCPGNP
jgi:hypothetical protein